MTLIKAGMTLALGICTDQNKIRRIISMKLVEVDMNASFGSNS